MTFYFDECISPYLVKAMRLGGAPGTLKSASESGMSGMADDRWIARIKELGWIAISSDRNDATRGITARQMAEAGITYLMLGRFFDHLSIWEKTKWFTAHWDKIYTASQSLPKGTVCLVLKNGSLKLPGSAKSNSKRK